MKPLPFKERQLSLFRDDDIVAEFFQRVREGYKEEMKAWRLKHGSTK